jgi:hypothetical protein
MRFSLGFSPGNHKVYEQRGSCFTYIDSLLKHLQQLKYCVHLPAYGGEVNKKKQTFSCRNNINFTSP